MVEEVKDMESHLYSKDFFGATQAGRAGLGMKKHTLSYKASSFEMRKLISDEIRTSQEEAHQPKAAEFSHH